MIKKVPYKITKSTVEVYRFRAEEGAYWADVTIDSPPAAHYGRISIASDFGSWNYYWGACGTPFKIFLAGCDQHYVAKNFGAASFFSAEATLKAYRQEVEQCYEKGSDEYTEVMNTITSIENRAIRKEDFF